VSCHVYMNKPRRNILNQDTDHVLVSLTFLIFFINMYLYKLIIRNGFFLHGKQVKEFFCCSGLFPCEFKRDLIKKSLKIHC
jgi:hypothetical protein